MKIVNVVVSGKFYRELSLCSLPNSVYRPKHFSGAIYKYDMCTFLLFANGSFVCLGASSKHMATSAIRSVATIFNMKIRYSSVKNMVMSHKVNFGINISNLYDAIKKAGQVVIYEDELFSGIVWKQDGGTIRLFHNGKFFITGLCRLMAIKKLCKMICKLCLENKINKRVN